MKDKTMQSRHRRAVVCTMLAALIGSSTSHASPADLCFRGLNISGAEYGEVDGVEGVNFTYPSAPTVAYFADKGFDTAALYEPFWISGTLNCSLTVPGRPMRTSRWNVWNASDRRMPWSGCGRSTGRCIRSWGRRR